MEVKPGYKQTEAGIIPEDWEVAELGDLIDYTKGYAFKSSEYTSDGIRIVRVSDTTYDSIREEDPVFVSKNKASKYSKWRLREDDLVISTVGSKPPMYDSMVGKVILIPRRHDGALLNQNAVLVRDKKRRAHFQRILLNHLRTKRYLTRIESIFRGNANQASITLKELFQFAIPFPDADTEQRAIARALSDADALISALDQLITKKRDFKQAAMQQLLTGKKRLTGFHGEWETQTIEQLEKARLVKLSRGKVISKKDIERVPGDYPIYSSSVHNDGLFGRYGDFMFDEELITWSVDGGGDFFHRPKHKFSVTNVCGFMRVDTSKISYRFLAAQLQLLHSRKNFDYLLKAHPSVIRKAYEVALPNLDEQTAIAEVLSDMETELAALEQRRDKTRALKQGMMQELLTGRTRFV
jgi:type I restriction enzyme S subunit